MGRLIRNVVLFVLVGAMLLVPVCIISRHQYRKTLEAPAFRFSQDTAILVAGDSHTEAAIDPRWLPHTQNIARSGENYFYTYYKLRHFLDRNPQVRLLILGMSWHNFSRDYQDNFLFGAESKAIGVYFPLLDESGRSCVQSWGNPYKLPWEKYVLGLPLKAYDARLLQRTWLGATLVREDFDFFGGYLKLSASRVEQTRISEKIQKYYACSEGSDFSASPHMMRYLEKILDLCTSRRVNIVLLNTPVHELYRKAVPAGARAYHDECLARLRTSHPEVIHLDYSSFQLKPGDYYDGDHVNAKGAEQVTKDLAANASILDLGAAPK